MLETITRTDIHRPSVINPEDYVFVALGHIRIQSLGDCFVAEQERKILQAHMDRTGGTWSRHQHGGNCMVCGAGCVYTAIFYHEATNAYIRTGCDCAEKLHMGDPNRFRKFMEACKAAEEHRAGKLKAQGVLEGRGLGQAWEIYANKAEDCVQQGREECTIRDIVEKLVKWGSISEKQENFLRSLVGRIANRAAIEAQRAIEKEAAKPAVSGRATVEGVVLKMDERETDFGLVWKMTVKTVDGWIAWGTAPAGVQGRGDRVKFTATFKVTDDPKFAVFSRPRLVEVVKAQDNP